MTVSLDEVVPSARPLPMTSASMRLDCRPVLEQGVRMEGMECLRKFGKKKFADHPTDKDNQQEIKGTIFAERRAAPQSGNGQKQQRYQPHEKCN
jgi:hypothetical protein